jgi:hypothetical protein
MGYNFSYCFLSFKSSKWAMVMPAAQDISKIKQFLFFYPKTLSRNKHQLPFFMPEVFDFSSGESENGSVYDSEVPAARPIYQGSTQPIQSTDL